MAHKASSSFIALILISNILLFSVSARSIAVNPNNDDKKFLFKSHGGVHIPGFGPVRFPPLGAIPNNPFTRGIGGGGAGAGAGAGPTGRSYVPGGDDTFVPNPGFEVPVPGGSGGRIPGSVHP